MVTLYAFGGVVTPNGEHAQAALNSAAGGSARAAQGRSRPRRRRRGHRHQNSQQRRRGRGCERRSGCLSHGDPPSVSTTGTHNLQIRIRPRSSQEQQPQALQAKTPDTRQTFPHPSLDYRADTTAGLGFYERHAAPQIAKSKSLDLSARRGPRDLVSRKSRRLGRCQRRWETAGSAQNSPVGLRPNRATRATIAFPESDRPDRPRAGDAYATAAVVRARYSLSAEQSWEGSTTTFGRSRRPPPLLQPWQRHSEAGAAARAEAAVARPGRARLDVGDSPSAPGLLDRPFRATTIGILRRHGTYPGSLRP